MIKIQKVFEGNEVPICFSANSDFVPYTAVMIRSIIDHASENKNYDIILLYAELRDELLSMLISLADGYENVSIRSVDVSEYIADFDFFTGSVYTKSPYSREVYFRLLIPTLMPDYDRVIYLDGDMLAFDDVAKLLDYEFPDALIASCRDYAGIAHCYTEGDDRRHYRTEVLGLSSVDNYIISGILIFNVEKFNSRFSADELMKISASYDWRQHDQDVLNKICDGEIFILGAEWNYLFGNKLIKNLPHNLYLEHQKSAKNPKIVHFAGERKPTAKNNVEFSDEFWTVAKRTPFYEILKKK